MRENNNASTEKSVSDKVFIKINNHDMPASQNLMAASVPIVDVKNDPTTKTISKNQIKRQFKWERAMEVKRRRKEQEKNIKVEQRLSEGRNIIAEQKEMEQNRKDGTGWAKRNEKWRERFKNNSSKHEIYLDCSFEEKMTYSEVNSLATQIRYCYAINKKAKHPVQLSCSSLSGETLNHLQNISGFSRWYHKAFFHTDQDIIGSYNNKSKLVYLTSDSENILTKLEDNKIYIIGGIVDRGKLKDVSLRRAEKNGIQTAKLPINEYLSLVSTKVLTCNHVFDILLKLKEKEGNWKDAILAVLPKKKY